MVLSKALALQSIALCPVLAATINCMLSGTGYSGITIKIRQMRPVNGANDFRGVYINLCIDALEFTGKVNIDTPADYSLIANAANAVLQRCNLSLSDMYVYRIDYCVNAVLDKSSRDLLQWMWRKCSSTYDRRLRFSAEHRKEVNSKNTTYYSNRSSAIQLYDKEEERKDKGKTVAPYEVNVLRYEYQTKFAEIKASWPLKGKDYWEWANDRTARGQLAKGAGLFFAGDFYSVTAADKELAHRGLPQKQLDKLHTFMVAVSRYGIDGAGKRCILPGKVKPISPKTAKSYRETLVAMGICPIPIPKRFAINHLENPFRDVLGGVV